SRRGGGADPADGPSAHDGAGERTRPVGADSTGAGDAFTGAFLAARLAGADAVEAAVAGCRAGAEAVTVVGGRPPYDDR
ncbi:sugar kinase, partial [Streptomyces sp. ms191]|uniref:PfkB family carbohydrate kinase n=1 Tax=Streptomyces sp. ms191 TaxID=1827978 RepID=UPI001311D1F6